MEKNSAPTGRIFMKFDIRVFFENLLRIFKFRENLIGMTGTLHEDLCTIMIISRSVLIMRNGADKIVEKIRTHFMFNDFFSLNLVYNLEKCCRALQATDDTIIRRMPFACWITKATNTHSEYVIFIAFPLQQWLRERA